MESMGKTIFYYKTKLPLLVHRTVNNSNKVLGLMNNLQTLLSSCSCKQFAIFYFHLPFFKNYDTVRDKILFPRYKKNHSHLRSILTISYNLFISYLILFFIPDLIFFESNCIDFIIYIIHYIIHIMNDNFLRQHLVSINLSICIPL